MRSKLVSPEHNREHTSREIEAKKAGSKSVNADLLSAISDAGRVQFSERVLLREAMTSSIGTSHSMETGTNVRRQASPAATTE
jgi:hypothetical protein